MLIVVMLLQNSKVLLIST